MKKIIINTLLYTFFILTTLSCSKSNNSITSESIELNHRFYFKNDKGHDLLTDVKLDDEHKTFFMRMQVDKSAYYRYDVIEAHKKTAIIFDTKIDLRFIRNPFKDIVNYGAREYTLLYKFTSPTAFGDEKEHVLTVIAECLTSETTDEFNVISAKMSSFDVEVFDVPNSKEKGFIFTDKR